MADVIAERLPATIELTLAALLLALLIAIPLGIAAAVKRGSLVDRVATVGSLFGVSLPGFWFGILLLILFSVNLKLLPVSGRTSLSCEVSSLTHLLTIDALLRGRFDCAGQALRYLTLPALTLALPTAAVLMRVMRTSMIEVLRSDYIAFAEAKGLSPRRVLLRHALKNALAPTVTVAAIETGSLLGGNMVVETVFGWPGLGRLVVESIFVAQLSARSGGGAALRGDLRAAQLRSRRHLHPPEPEGGAVSAIPAPASLVAAEPASPGRMGLRNFVSNRMSLVSAVVVVLIVLIAAAAPWTAPHDPYDTDLLRRLQPPAWLEGGEFSYLLGCDALGRDILSRIVYGARVSIVIGVVVVALATAIGIALGLAAGYLRGWTDVAISRVVDILLGFPYLIFAIALMAMMGPGVQNIVLALVYKEWVIPCRVVRGETLAMRQTEFVEAARAIGASRRRIMFGEILPNILSPVIVVATVRMAHVIILEASLSFLGLGVQPPTASWGSMVADGRDFTFDAWWCPTFRGLSSSCSCSPSTSSSQGLRDAFDPKINDRARPRDPAVDPRSEDMRFRPAQVVVTAVDGVSLDVRAGEMPGRRRRDPAAASA